MEREDGQIDWDDAFALFEKAIEGGLSQPEGVRLDAIVSNNAEVRRAYLEYMHQHACLHWEGVSIRDADIRDFLQSLGEPTAQNCEPNALAPGPRLAPSAQSKSTRWIVAITAGIALLAVAYYGGTRMGTPGKTEPTVVATLIRAKACTWGGGSLPTDEGSQLHSGTMKLVSGLATLQFTSGAEVTLEAPAELELVDSMKCILHDGTLVANVPTQAKGFVVETDTAHLVDQGTEFGVFVDRDDGTTDVQVFDGIVDVERRITREQQRMLAGERTIIDKHRFESAGVESDEAGRELPPSANGFENAIAITTADGDGREGFVYPGQTKSHVFKPLLPVKNSAGKPEHSRKIFLAFDLNALEGWRARRARLRLQIQRDGRGYASLVPDATFAVYGVTDETLDQWNARKLNWDNAPANLPGGAAVDPTKTRLLGRFVIPQGTYTGFAAIEGDQLAGFLREDTNGIATIVIVRETQETRGGGLVHAFAGGNHPEGVAPTLHVQVRSDSQ